MSNAPYLLKEARFGFRMGDAKAIDAMINDGLRNPFSGKQMFEEAGEVADELEMTRARPRPLGAAQPRARDRGDRRGPPARGDRARDGQGPEGRHGRRDRRGPAPRLVARVAVEAQAAQRATRARTPPATRRASTTAAARSCSPRPSGRSATARRSSPRSSPRRAVADDFAYLARTPAAAAKKALEKAGLSAEDVDLWEINEAFASVARQLGPRARHRRGQGQRQRRRGRARPPDRRLRRAHPRHARARAAPARRRHRLRGDLQRRRPGRRRARQGERRLSDERIHSDAQAGGRLARGGLLRPRPHADGRLVRLPLGARGAAGRA